MRVRRKKPVVASSPQRSHRRPLVLLTLILLAGAGLRVRLVSVPLERDEGEYGYAGQLLLRGQAPFDGARNMKMPGIYAIFAAFMALFGQTDSGIHLGLLITNAATTLLLYWLIRRLYDDAVALAAAAAFTLLSLLTPVQGM